MASLADIPNIFFEQGKTDDFVKWVTELPIAVHFKRSLAIAWANTTGNILSADHWSKINAPEVAT